MFLKVFYQTYLMTMFIMMSLLPINLFAFGDISVGGSFVLELPSCLVLVSDHSTEGEQIRHFDYKKGFSIFLDKNFLDYLTVGVEIGKRITPDHRVDARYFGIRFMKFPSLFPMSSLSAYYGVVLGFAGNNLSFSQEQFLLPSSKEKLDDLLSNDITDLFDFLNFKSISTLGPLIVAKLGLEFEMGNGWLLYGGYQLSCSIIPAHVFEAGIKLSFDR